MFFFSLGMVSQVVAPLGLRDEARRPCAEIRQRDGNRGLADGRHHSPYATLGH